MENNNIKNLLKQILKEFNLETKYNINDFTDTSDGCSNTTLFNNKTNEYLKFGLTNSKNKELLTKLHRVSLNNNIISLLNKRYNNYIKEFKVTKDNFLIITKKINNSYFSMEKATEKEISLLIDELNFLSNINDSSFIFDVRKEIDEYHHLLNIKEDNYFSKLEKLLQTYINKYPQIFKKGLCHIDLLESNILINKDDNNNNLDKVTLIDYDFLYYSYVIWDLISYISEQRYLFESISDDLLKNNEVFTSLFFKKILNIEDKETIDMFNKEIYPLLVAILDYFWYVWAKGYLIYYSENIDEEKIFIFNLLIEISYNAYTEYINKNIDLLNKLQ